MGWLVGWNSKKEVVEHLKQEIGERLVRAQVVGKVLWTVEKSHLGERFIGCYLLDGGRGPGVRDPRWGYKDMEEAMGPVEVSCPLAFLELAPPAKSKYAAGWRERVRAYHAERAAQESAVEGAQTGDRVELREGCKPPVLTVTGKRGRSLLAEAGGRVYRVASRHIARVVHAAALH